LPLLPLPPCPKNPILAASAPAATTQSSTNQKLAAIKTYRRALGLCFKCGTKWSKDHRCPLEVLQAVDALWDSLSSEDPLADSSPDDSPAEHLKLVLSKSVMSGIPAARTIRLMGFIQQIPVQILVDSNSSSSFINVSLVSQLQDIQVYALPSSIQVTGGSMLVSQSILRNVRWAVDSCTF
jgi:hypothetical protein